MKIIKQENRPSTVNAWGFGGSTNKKRFVMENGDIWVSGIAWYRHMPHEKYIQAKFNASSDWDGGLTADKDVLLKGKPEKYIHKFYN